MLKKATPKKAKKSPWVPPPGRTKQPEKTPTKTLSEGTPTISPIEKARDERHVVDDTLDLASLCSDSSLGKWKNGDDVNLCSAKDEMKLVTIHYRTLKRMSLFLNRYFSTHRIGNITVKDLVSIIDNSVKDIIYELSELEYAITLVENTLDPESKFQEHFKMVQIKGNLLSKVLDCYSKSVTIFETIIQTQSTEDFTRTQINQEILQKQLQISEKKCASQSAMIKDFERRLSILQGRTNTVESYKSTLENTRTELEKQLTFKESQIKYLNNELSRQISSRHNYDDKEELLEIIEKIKKNAVAEKTALKKALKLQKLRTDTSKEVIEKLTRDLKEKEKIMHSLAGQRDQLKLQLTKAKNSIIEDTSDMQEMKIQNMKLEEEFCKKESTYKTQLKKIEDCLCEKTTQLNDVMEEKLKLQKELNSMMKTTEITMNELNTLKSNCTNIDAMLSQGHGDGNQVNALEDVKHLITLLQDAKDYFKNAKSTSLYLSANEDENFADANDIDSTQKSILTAVEEIKSHLLELKDICDCSSKQNQNMELERKLKEIELLYNESSKENEALKSEIDGLRMSRYSNLQNFSSVMPESEFSNKNLEIELRLKTEENWRYKQREKELERQLDEIKEKLQRKEAENIRLYSVEEDLQLRKNELSVLECKREEESEKSQRKIRELQESLDKVTTDYESHKRYVQVLKSSYLNVFGES